MRNRHNIFQLLDWTTILLYLILVFIGWLNIYAAVYSEDHQNIMDISQRYGKQLIWIGAACILAISILLIDFRFFNSFGYALYIIMILLLIGVVLFGTEIKGARSWFTFGSIAIQPSEFAKFATGLALAKFLSSMNVKVKDTRTKLISGVIIFLPALLILLQPDTGSTLVYAAFLLVLYREGLSGTYFTVVISIAVLFVFTLLVRSLELNLPFDLSLNGGWILVSILALAAVIITFVFRNIKYVWQVVLAIFILSSVVIMSVDLYLTTFFSLIKQNELTFFLAWKMT